MADEEDDLEEEEVQGPPPSKLVFVNHVDSYTGSSVAKVRNESIAVLPTAFRRCTKYTRFG